MAKKIKTESIDEIIVSLENEAQALNEKIAKKIAEYDARAKEKKDLFMNESIEPMQNDLGKIKAEIKKYQQVKSILG